MNQIDISKIIQSCNNNRYCSPTLNEIKFIENNQTLSLVLGSCISTVFIGRNDSYVLAANHIVMARPPEGSRIASKSAQEQIDTIITIFEKHYNIRKKDLICLHFIGAGKKLEGSVYKINEDNIKYTREILRDMNCKIIFNDTGSYTVSKYSIADRNLSVFVENKFLSEHLSFAIDLDKLFRIDPLIIPRLPISSLKRSKEFDYLVDEGIIFIITGTKLR